MVSERIQVVPEDVSQETKRVTQLWNPSKPVDGHPDWWVWTGGWYELDGESNYYTNWDCLRVDSIVLDIGGYRGEWSWRMSTKYNPIIHLFEPAEKAYDAAIDRLKDRSRVYCWNFGLGSKCGIFRLYDPTRDGASFYKLEGDHVHARIKNISKWLMQQNIYRVDLASLNTEGAEFEILPYLIGTGEIEVFDRWMIQWHHMFENSAALQLMIQEAMARTHRMVWNLGAWEAWVRKDIE